MEPNQLSGCTCIPVAGSHRPPRAWAAQVGRTDPAEVDGPGPEYYRELAEERGTPWPRGIHITRLSHTVGFALARTRMPEMWPCPKCGGPKLCPDLAATMPFRECGYAPVDPAEPFGRWVHQ